MGGNRIFLPFIDEHRFLPRGNGRHKGFCAQLYRDGYLFKYFEYTGDDYEADMQVLAEDEEHQRWLEFTAVCQKPVDSAKEDEWWAPMKEIFHLG